MGVGVTPGFGFGGAAAGGINWKIVVAPPGTGSLPGFGRSVSMGRVSVAGLTGTGPVLSRPGVDIEMFEFEGMKVFGYFRSGTACPAGMGRTTSGGMITSSS